MIAGNVLAEFWRTKACPLPPNPLGVGSSARNRFVGLVTKVVSDKVMTHVEMQCGPPSDLLTLAALKTEHNFRSVASRCYRSMLNRPKFGVRTVFS